MMKFHEKGYTIEVHTGIQPYEDWIDVMNGLLDLLMLQDGDMRERKANYFVFKLMSDMMPTAENLREYIDSQRNGN